MKKRGKFYFTVDTQNAIIEYNKCKNINEKNKIFNDRIKEPFNKLAENIINRFKFQYFDIPLADVKGDVVTVLLMKMHNYTESKGKAFSYFSVVAKNYLIRVNNNNYKKYKSNVKLYSSSPLHNDDDELLEINYKNQYNLTEIHLNDEMREFSVLFVKNIESNIDELFKKKRDIEICYSILEIIRRSYNVENFNKKAIYILIREMTGYGTQYITKVIGRIKSEYRQLYKKYLKTGCI